MMFPISRGSSIPTNSGPGFCSCWRIPSMASLHSRPFLHERTEKSSSKVCRTCSACALKIGERRCVDGASSVNVVEYPPKIEKLYGVFSETNTSPTIYCRYIEPEYLPLCHFMFASFSLDSRKYRRIS